MTSFMRTRSHPLSESKTEIGNLDRAVESILNELEEQIGAIATGLTPSGEWSPAAGAFPEEASLGTFYIVGDAGTLSDVDFSVGDWLIPLKAGASRHAFLGEWFRAKYSKVTPRTFKNLNDLTNSIERARGIGSIWDAGGFRYEEVNFGEHLKTAGNVKLAEAGPYFSNITRLREAIARGYEVSEGQIVYAGGSPYVGDPISIDPAQGIRQHFDINYLRTSSASYVDPTWLGLSVAASAATNAAAMNEALADPRKIILPRGAYLCDPVSTTVSTPNDVIIEGAGASATVFDFGESGGLEVIVKGAPDQMQGDKISIDISGLGFRTGSIGRHTALRIQVPDDGAGEAGTHVLRSLSKLSFAGSTLTSYWANGIHITNGSYWNIDECWARGPESSKGGTFIFIDGSLSSVDTFIGRIKGANFSEGIVCVGRNEGLTVRDAILVNVNTGIRHQPSLLQTETDQPWLHISGGHIKASDFGVSVDNVTQAQILGTLIYLDSPDALGILLRRRGATNGVGSHHISSQVASLIGAHNQVGVQMDRYTGQSILSGNRFSSLKHGIVLLSDSNQNIGHDNLASELSGEPLVDLGSGNSVRITSF